MIHFMAGILIKFNKKKTYCLSHVHVNVPHVMNLLISDNNILYELRTICFNYVRYVTIISRRLFDNYSPQACRH